jgi:tetratricopeptide (TPR) repeat protein
MQAVFKVTIAPANKKGHFRITWFNVATHAKKSFEQSSVGIDRDEVEWLWKDRRNQLEIGEKLFRFLDGKGGHLQQALKQAEALDEDLQIHLSAGGETVNWPFELLARDGTFLLPSLLHLVRSAPEGEGIEETPPQNRRLRLLFMACSPLDVKPELDFEQEEETIFKATEKLAIDMEIEDTGSLAGLREKLEQQQYDIVHLSGFAGIDQKGQPFFVMEDEAGYHEDVAVERLWHEGLKVNPPRLLFISGSSTGDAPGGVEGTFAHILVEKYQVPAVLGWGRWVSDEEATEAAKVIYRELSRGKSVLHAVQRARYRLVDRFPSTLKPSWPQLRLFGHGSSLQAIVEKEQETRPQVRRMTHTYLKNSEVKVLAEGFVGRRRQLQQGFRVLTLEPGKAGLLLLGSGGLGKSCLAGKISERFKEHTPVIVHGRLNSITLKRALKDAFIVSQDDHGKNVLFWDMEMKDILGVLCRSCFKDKKYLILLDDFEQNLEGSDRGEPAGLFPEAAELLKVLLDALPGTDKSTQMIITCRYGFFMTIEDRDLVKERLEPVWLAGFREAEQRKKAGELPNIADYPDPDLKKALLAAGCGNPRLMEWLDVLVGQQKSPDVVELLQAVSSKKEDFIQQHVIRELLKLGGQDLSRFLSWFAIYRRPVLKEGAKQVGEKANLKNWQKMLYRGMKLSLIEHDTAHKSYQATPLLKEEFLSKLDNFNTCHQAAFTYYKSLCESKPSDQFDPILVEEWVYHSLSCGEEIVAFREGSDLVSHLRRGLAFLESRRVGLWVLEQKKREFSNEYDASLLNNLGYTMYSAGDYLKAIDYYQEALAIWKDLYGDKHQEVAIPLNNLGVVYTALGDPHKATECYQEALVISKVVYGETHPQVATTLNSLGTAWYELGDARKAIDFYQEALTIWKDVYGEKYIDVVSVLNNLGWARLTLGEPWKAIDYFQEALTIGKEVYGETHPQVAIGMNALGKVWHELGDSRKAINYYQEALAIREAVFGSDHPDVALDLNSLGGAWEELGESRKAIDYFEHALSIDEAVFGRDHPNVASDLNNLGSVWATLGDPRKAIEYYQEALATWKDIYGETHPQVAIALNALGAAWYDLGDPRKAIEYFENALTIDEAVFGRGHPDVATDLNNLGSAWITLSDPHKSIEYYQEALTIRKSVYGETHPHVATTLCSLGAAWYYLGGHGKAIDYYQTALTILNELYGKKHPTIAITLNNLGAAWYDLGEPRKAIHYYQEAIAIDDAMFGHEHPNVARDLHNLGCAYFDLGQTEKAKDHFEEAYAIYNKLFGPKHPDAKIVNEWLAKLTEGKQKTV